jgi:hypothetical protein
MGIDFNFNVRTRYREIDLPEYFNGTCPFCESNQVIIRSSRWRELPDLGSPFEKMIVRLKEAYIYCQDCGATFTPEHPAFPPDLEYSQAIVEYALTSFHYNNDSGETIARNLARLHQVEVPAATIYSWLKRYSPAYLKAQIDGRPTEDLSHIKTVTVDGTYVHTGSAVIGKKKDVESLSVTKLADGRYLLMWWE